MKRQLLASAAAILGAATGVSAQGVASAGIAGIVRDSDSSAIDGAVLRVTNTSTGYAVTLSARRGRFLVEGLEPGGPYSVAVRRIGFAPRRIDGIVLSLGEMVELELTMRRSAVEIAPTRIVGQSTDADARTEGGTGTLFGDDFLHSLPNLNRDLYDFVRLVPQVSTRISLPNTGFSAAGTGFRFNNFLVGGASERTASGNVSSAFSGMKSIPLDAVKEYQVLLAPYDVRYGDFAGALVNSITRSGTNRYEGSAFVFARNDKLGRSSSATGGSSYDRAQYGVTIGGPVVPDRLHFLVSTELQHFTYPAAGPYVGQPADAEPPVPVSEADLGRLDDVLGRYGIAGGSAGAMKNGNPLVNIFSRLDLSIPSSNSRATAWYSYGDSEDIIFSRQDTFRLSSSRLNRVASSSLGVLQVHTTLSRQGGGHNELLVSARRDKQGLLPDERHPTIRVLVPRLSGGRETVYAGTPEPGQGLGARSRTFSIKDDLTVPLGSSHTVSIGAQADWSWLRRFGVLNGFGSWSFASIDDLEAGVAERYEVGLDFGSATVPLRADQQSAYVSDKWQVSPALSVTAGIRGDLLNLRNHAPYNAGVDSAFGRRTDRLPRKRVELSPRLGFVLSLPGDETRLRGGAGVFATRYPLAWAHVSLMSYGAGGGVLRCGRTPADLGFPPAFDPNPANPPRECANGATIAENQRGDVDLLDEDMRMMRVLRSSLAYDRSLPHGFLVSGEALFSSALSDFVFVNLRLDGPVGQDENGRVMYGTLSPSGAAAPNFRSGFSEVIDVIDVPHTRSLQLSARAEKNVGDRAHVTASYTFSRVRDAMTPIRVNTRGTVTWGSARVMSGRHDDFSRSVSSNDIPHRVVAAGSYAIPRRWRTELSFYYLGESGRPFTFVAFGSSRRGDLNADGVATNDPVYVPRDAFDEREILFDATLESIRTQQESLESFISGTPCLRRQRGKILDRNSCREAWSNTTIAAIRQQLPGVARGLEVQFDVFNVLNLLKSDWGLRRESIPFLLEHTRQAAGSAGPSRPVFFFDSERSLSTTDRIASSFQLQAAVRYRF